MGIPKNDLSLIIILYHYFAKKHSPFMIKSAVRVIRNIFYGYIIAVFLEFFISKANFYYSRNKTPILVFS